MGFRSLEGKKTKEMASDLYFLIIYLSAGEPLSTQSLPLEYFSLYLDWNIMSGGVDGLLFL